VPCWLHAVAEIVSAAAITIKIEITLVVIITWEIS